MVTSFPSPIMAELNKGKWGEWKEKGGGERKMPRLLKGPIGTI